QRAEAAVAPRGDPRPDREEVPRMPERDPRRRPALRLLHLRGGRHRLSGPGRSFDAGALPQLNCPVGRFRPHFHVWSAMTSTKTFSPKARHIERRWYVVDADGAVLGRLASEVAKILRGKHKPIFAPHVDTGDHVIVVNARGVRLTGGKENEKVYYRHSGYPGGLREIGYAKLL